MNDTEAQLLAQGRRPAKPILKLLRSAVANAKNNKQLNADHLFVKEVRVDQGPMLKRMLPRARGSASPIQKKMSHVTLVLGVDETLRSRFKLVVPKKAKLPPGREKPTGKKRTAPEKLAADSGEPKKKQTKQGFFKKMFNRKTGMGN